jgi:hypothetical protein
MDTTIVSAMAGVLGSLVGASTTIATGWITQKTLNKRELSRTEINKREMLYAGFIRECSKLIVDAYGLHWKSPRRCCPRMHFSTAFGFRHPTQFLRRRKITEQYFSPNLALEDMYSLIRSPWTDPLKALGEACRDELKSIRADV